MERLLLTGAAGRIGSVLRAGLRGTVGVLRLMHIQPLEARAGEEVVQGDVRSLEDARRALVDCDAVVHLAGIPNEAEFEAILEANIRGTYNVFKAARLDRSSWSGLNSRQVPIRDARSGYNRPS